MKRLAIILSALVLGCGNGPAATRCELIKGPSAQYPLAVVVNSDEGLFWWVERSDDGGKTWYEEARVVAGEWYFLAMRGEATSLFRAKLME